jgi:ABC-type lipoprotein export system ATPase subunit
MNHDQRKKNLYHLSDVHFGYQWGGGKVNVLQGVNLEIQRASFVCIMGPSGTGKTTLLNLMGLLSRPDQGVVEFDGRDISQLKEKQAEIIRLNELGFVFQSFHLIPTLTVLENTSYFLYTLGLLKDDAHQRAIEMLGKVGLGSKINKYVGELSGGERQRVAIARALVKNPKVVLADEPTANLDRKTAGEIIDVFKELQKAGTAFIFCTHDQHLLSHGERKLSLFEGKIQELSL